MDHLQDHFMVAEAEEPDQECCILAVLHSVLILADMLKTLLQAVAMDKLEESELNGEILTLKEYRCLLN
jgi:hypothetical protein